MTDIGIILLGNTITYGFMINDQSGYFEVEYKGRLHLTESVDKLADFFSALLDMIQRKHRISIQRVLITKPGLSFKERCYIYSALEKCGVHSIIMHHLGNLLSAYLYTRYPSTSEIEKTLSIYRYKDTYEICISENYSGGMVEIVQRKTIIINKVQDHQEQVQQGVMKVIDSLGEKGKIIASELKRIFISDHVSEELYLWLMHIFQKPCIVFKSRADIYCTVHYLQVLQGRRDLLLLTITGYKARTSLKVIVPDTWCIPSKLTDSMMYNTGRELQCLDIYIEDDLEEVSHLILNIASIIDRNTRQIELKVECNIDAHNNIGFTVMNMSKNQIVRISPSDVRRNVCQ